MSSEPIACGRCGAAYDRAAFAALQMLRTIPLAEVATLVVRWPDNATVGVRRCAGCAHPIARLVL